MAAWVRTLLKGIKTTTTRSCNLDGDLGLRTKVRGFRYAGVIALIKSSDSEVRLVGRRYPRLLAKAKQNTLWA